MLAKQIPMNFWSMFFLVSKLQLPIHWPSSNRKVLLNYQVFIFHQFLNTSIYKVLEAIDIRNHPDYRITAKHRMAHRKNNCWSKLCGYEMNAKVHSFLSHSWIFIFLLCPKFNWCRKFRNASIDNRSTCFIHASWIVYYMSCSCE